MSVEFIRFLPHHNSSETIVRTGPILPVPYIETCANAPKLERVSHQLMPYKPGGISTLLGGGSEAAIEAAGKHADPLALWGESYAQVRDVASRVRAAPAKHGRPTPRFSLSVRPILADTEEKAWAKAEEILARATALQDKTGYRKPADGHATAGARRLLALAEQGSRIDKRLWTQIAKPTDTHTNPTTLVGTPAQVAEVFCDYYDLGFSHFLILG